MVVVVATILILVTLIVPAATSLWRDRRVAEAQNTISGLLMTTRARAMQSGGAETGLFFYVDEQGVQRIASIAQDAAKASNPATAANWANVFRIAPDRDYALPAPMRAVPRFVVDDPAQDATGLRTFDDDELANNDVINPVNTEDPFQRHRNFFSLVYGGNGQLLFLRDVLISDKNDDAGAQPPTSGSQVGDVTELVVADETKVNTYHVVDAAGVATKRDLKNLNDGPTPPDDFFVVDPDKVAINFPSVDGLLVYDESLFSSAGSAEQKRQYLLDAAQPFYIHRLTGAVIRGPVGENVAVGP